MRRETIGSCTLYLGDCREISADGKRRPFGCTPIKEVAHCRSCLWSWKPTTGRGREACPNCGKIRDVRARQHKPNFGALKTYVPPSGVNRATKAERNYRSRARLLVGHGVLECKRCGCDQEPLLEINHINGGGGKEHKATGNRFYREIARLRRGVDDLELLCKPCNAVHALELKHGPLPFQVVWRGADV